MVGPFIGVVEGGRGGNLVELTRCPGGVRVRVNRGDAADFNLEQAKAMRAALDEYITGEESIIVRNSGARRVHSQRVLDTHITVRTAQKIVDGDTHVYMVIGTTTDRVPAVRTVEIPVMAAEWVAGVLLKKGG